VSGRYDLGKGLRDARDQRTMGMHSAAIREYGTLLERVIETLYTEAWSYLVPSEKQRIAEIESKIVRQNPLQVKFTLGNWIELFQSPSSMVLALRVSVSKGLSKIL